MSLAKDYICDRKGCKSHTRQLGNEQEFFNTYADINWIFVKIGEERFDFCAYECLSLWAENKANEIRGGKAK